MTRTLEFSPELENRLRVLAARRGTSVEAFVLQVMEVAATQPDFAADSEVMAVHYARSLAEKGDLTAFSDAQEDIYQYSAGDLAKMERGEFERPLR